MSESEKRKCYFVQYSEDFLYDPKVQKLYSIPNTGKAFVAVYLHLMLLAAKNGGFIVHDPLYSTLGEQLEAHMLYTSKDEIDFVIRFFTNPDFGEKYIRRVDDIYTFLQAQEMTQSKTVGALNKARQRKNQASDKKPTLSANCPPLVGNNNNNIHSYTYINNNIVELLLAESIAESIVREKIENLGYEAVAEAYHYAVCRMPANPKNRAGFILSCIDRKLKLNQSEKEKIQATQKQREADEATAQEEAAKLAAMAEQEEAERLATYLWWDFLDFDQKEIVWEKAINQVNSFQRRYFADLAIPQKLELLPNNLSTIISIITQLRKESQNDN